MSNHPLTPLPIAPHTQPEAPAPVLSATSTQKNATPSGAGCNSGGQPPWGAFLPLIVLITFFIMWLKNKRRDRDEDDE